MTRAFLFLLTLLSFHAISVSVEASPEDRVTTMEAPFDTTRFPFAEDEMARAGRSFCSESYYCRDRNVTISCTAEGNSVSCSSGAGWVRCQAGSQVSTNRC